VLMPARVATPRDRDDPRDIEMRASFRFYGAPNDSFLAVAFAAARLDTASERNESRSRNLDL